MRAAPVFHQALRHPWPIFAAALTLAVVGFWPSFFGRLSVTPVPHHIHGWSATTWMTLPLLQYALIRSGRTSVHRFVGYGALALAAIVAGSGVYAVRMMAFSNITSFRLASVKFVWLDLTGIVLFSVYVAVAVSAARQSDIRLHVTALAASALIPLEAALERVFVNLFPAIAPDFNAGLYAALIFLEITCASIIWLEWRSGCVRWPIPLLLAYYLFMHVTMTPLATSQGFQQFSNWFGMVGRAAN